MRRFTQKWTGLAVLLSIALLLGSIPLIGRALAVGTVTIVPNTRVVGNLKRIEWSWTSDASGNVSATVSQNVNGKILRVITDPGATAPTDNYDVTILDQDGVDVLIGRGADRDTANTEQICPSLTMTDGTTAAAQHVAVVGTLELRVANAGNAKVGKVIVILE